MTKEEQIRVFKAYRACQLSDKQLKLISSMLNPRERIEMADNIAALMEEEKNARKDQRRREA